MNTNTEPSATIICTKSQFRAALEIEFSIAMVESTEANMAEVREALAELARQADATRGVFQGYSDYLDLAYVVSPDAEQVIPLKIPAVTDAQRVQAEMAAASTVLQAVRALQVAAENLYQQANGQTVADARVVDAFATDLRAWADRLAAAAGQIRLAKH